MAASSEQSVPPPLPEFKGAHTVSHQKSLSSQGVYFLPEETMGDDTSAILDVPAHTTGQENNMAVWLPHRFLAYHRIGNQPLSFETRTSDTFWSLEAIARYLEEMGIPVHIERGMSLEDLAIPVEAGACVAISINLGELYDDARSLEAGEANGIALVRTIGRDVQTDIIALCRLQIDQAYLEIDTLHLQRTWLGAGGWLLVSDEVPG